MQWWSGLQALAYSQNNILKQQDEYVCMGSSHNCNSYELLEHYFLQISQLLQLCMICTCKWVECGLTVFFCFFLISNHTLIDGNYSSWFQWQRPHLLQRCSLQMNLMCIILSLCQLLLSFVGASCAALCAATTVSIGSGKEGFVQNLMLELQVRLNLCIYYWLLHSDVQEVHE